MKKLSLLIVLVLHFQLIFCQQENEAQKETSAKFEKFFNSGQYDSIFNQFSPDMQKALPLPKALEFLNGLKGQAGKIVTREFNNYKPPYASYKTKFEKTTFDLQLAISNDRKIFGLFVKPFVAGNLPVLTKNTTPLILPFKDEWTVIWGGDTKEQNYHVESRPQKNAFDMVITDAKGKSYKTDGKKNEDYYAFGKELVAPCDGEVVTVIDGIEDNIPGEMNPIYLPGNTVVIKTTNNEFLFFAHFKQQSIKVKQGQKVKKGDVLGLCGNSGNSSEAHLHFHIQNISNMVNATGAKCFFEKIFVNGSAQTNYSPVKGDKVRN
jgi:murein DD-endopeptidase MepM/ murein hydrolase activator NlpD